MLMLVRRVSVACVMLAVVAFLLAGCDKSRSDQKSNTPAASGQAQSGGGQKAPLIQKKEAVDWCREHGVPESACTKCNTALIAEFKKKGDWCKEHNVPESQCLICHPELKEKFEAMRPKT